MPVPQYDDLMNPTLIALKNLGGQAHIRNIEQKVAEQLKLSYDDINDIHRGTTTKLVYRLAWSRNYLKRFGLVENTERGVWKLTPDGQKRDLVDKEEVKRVVKSIDYKEEEIEQDIFETDNIDPDEPIEIEGKEEDATEENTDIVSPFDPKDIKIIVEPKTIDHLVTRLRYNEIDLNTEFQRKGNLWKPDVQSRLIESILLRLPLPAFYFDAEDENKWLVVDGLQRLWSIKNFIVNSEREEEGEVPLELNGLEILTDFSNKNITFKNLSRTMQRRILETPITTYLIQPGTPKQVKYNVFRRINTGGLGLNSMEIRNALNQGKAANFLRELSENPRLKEVLKLQDKRMEDRELLLRAYAFIQNDYSKYEKPLSTFLDKAMETITFKDDKELNNLSHGIIDAIYFQKILFGRDIFSRSILGGRNRVRLNSALFEVWVSEIYKLKDDQKQMLVINKDRLIENYKNLLSTDKFIGAVVSSTSGKGAVKTRFEEIHNLINLFFK